MRVTTADVLAVLDELAELTTLDEGTPQSFRVRAFERARRGIEAAAVDVTAMSPVELVTIEGVGPSIAAAVSELVATGTTPTLERLRAAYPPGVVAVSRVPGIGPKTLALLRDRLDVESIADLEAALAGHRLRDLPGVGPAREARIARALARLAPDRVPVAVALPIAERLAAEIAAAEGVESCTVAGSLRRMAETVGDIDLVVVGRPEAAMDAAASAGEMVDRGATRMRVVTGSGLGIDVRVVVAESAGAALLSITGSKAHNVVLRRQAAERGWLLNEYGLFAGDRRLGATEEEVYRALGLAPIPPPLREDTGEIEAAAVGTLPPVARIGDIRGDFHVHTTRSGDGRSTVADMLAAAAARGYEYVALTDHGASLTVNGSSPAEMLAHREAVRAEAERYPGMDVYFGCELSIGPDGSLDYDPDFREIFDMTVASIHSHFDLDATAQTERILRAAADPAVDVIGHLTGRVIGRRPGIELDIDAVLGGLAAAGVALEANAALDRLDAPAEVLRRAVALGVGIVVSTDAHHVSELDRMRWGVAYAARGWVPAASILNTRPRADTAAWLGG